MKGSFLCIITFVIFGLTACNSSDSRQEAKKDSIQTGKDSSGTGNVVSQKKIEKSMYLEDVLTCINLEGLEKKYGKENIKKESKIESGEGVFEVTKLFPDTEKEVLIYWKIKEKFRQIADAMVMVKYGRDEKESFSKEWIAKSGIHLGMKLSEVVALNQKAFTITGLGWDLGGSVVSWEGGKLANQNLHVRFNDFSGNNGGLTEEEYKQISGELEFDVSHPSLKKLNPVVDQLSVSAKITLDPTTGKKMGAEVERKQIKR